MTFLSERDGLETPAVETSAALLGFESKSNESRLEPISINSQA